MGRAMCRLRALLPDIDPARRVPSVCFRPEGTGWVLSAGTAEPELDTDAWSESPAHRLNLLWTRLRARLAKTPELRAAFFLKFLEPHQDGTPHMHVMLWLPRVHLTRRGEEHSTLGICAAL